MSLESAFTWDVSKTKTAQWVSVLDHRVSVLDQWVFALHQWVFVLDQWVFASDQLVFVLDQWVFLLDYWVSSLRFRHIQTQDGLIYTRIKDTESMFSVL